MEFTFNALIQYALPSKTIWLPAPRKFSEWKKNWPPKMRGIFNLDVKRRKIFLEKLRRAAKVTNNFEKILAKSASIDAAYNLVPPPVVSTSDWLTKPRRRTRKE